MSMSNPIEIYVEDGYLKIVDDDMRHVGFDRLHVSQAAKSKIDKPPAYLDIDHGNKTERLTLYADSVPNEMVYHVVLLGTAVNAEKPETTNEIFQVLFDVVGAV